MKVQWSPLALEQAEQAMNFIAAEGRPATAAAWLDGLFERVRNLSVFPEQGRVVPEIGQKEIREIQYQGFRVLYRVSPGTVGILSVRHGRRRPLPPT